LSIDSTHPCPSPFSFAVTEYLKLDNL
jgi:hypothetical protein